MTRRSPSRNAGSPSEAKISGIDMPAASTISWSLSVKATPSSAGEPLADAGLAGAHQPDQHQRPPQAQRRGGGGSGSGGSIIAIAVFPRPG